MNDVSMKPAEAESTEVAVFADPITALAVLRDAKAADDFYAKVKAECDAHVPDLDTVGGRKAIASLAHKIARTKTAIDKARLSETEGLRAQVEAINTAGKKQTERLDALKAEVRKPLTEWEEADKARQQDVAAKLTLIEQAAIVTLEDNVQTVEHRIQHIGGIEITDAWFDEYAAAARAQRDRTLEALRAALDRLRQEAANAAELARLQAAEQERLQREAEKQAQARAEQEAAEAREREEREAEEARQAQERAAARAAEEAAEQARLEAQRRAQEEQAERDRAHQAQLQAQQAATAAAQAEASRLAGEKAERERAEAAEAEAARKRQADRDHRAKVMGEAKAAIMALGVKEDVARKVVLAIVAAEIPAVSLTF